MKQQNISITIIVAIVILGGVWFTTRKSQLTQKSGVSQQTVIDTGSMMFQPSDTELQPFTGEKGETLKGIEGKVSIEKAGFETNVVKFFNVGLEDGKTVYFLVLKDDAGNFRIAANANEKCAPYGKGYKQEGDKLTCITCGKSYPIKDFAIEQPDCNPKPLTAKAEVDATKVNILLTDLQKLAYLFN